MKAWQVAYRLLYQNRWLYLLLVLLPPGLAALVLLSGSPPDLGDVLSILHQECLYGLALVVFSGSAQLGNEQRSRRVVGVLSRAVSRPEYLLALLYTAWLPLALYAASVLMSGMLLISPTGQSPTGVIAMACVLLLLGLWAATVSLFFATWLPSLLASGASLALISSIAFMGHSSPGPGKLLGSLIGTGPEAWMPTEPASQIPVGQISTWLSILVAAAAFFAAAAAIFNRRDLRLKED